MSTLADINCMGTSRHTLSMVTVESFSDFTGNPVVKTVIKPFSGKRSARMLFRVFVTIKGGINSSVKGCGVGMHVVPKHTVKLCQRGNGIDIQGIEPSFLHGAEVSLNFAFVGSVTDFLCEEAEYQVKHRSWKAARYCNCSRYLHTVYLEYRRWRWHF